MTRRLWLVLLGTSVGCASMPNADGTAASAWPRGSEPQLGTAIGVSFGGPGSVRLVTAAPMDVLFLELRPSFDSLDVRTSDDASPRVALAGTSELLLSMQTVDQLQRATASMPATNCSILKAGAGDPTGHEVCPVSRSYGPEPSRTWRYRNRVFLLVSDRPFAPLLPRTIPWAANRTIPPVVSGSKWTALEL